MMEECQDPGCHHHGQDTSRYVLPAMDFDEEKCRNCLIKQCAHIPRNYQYRDGVPLIFLILRDFMGDEHLGHACGVLYELIEIDCQRTDDKGAAFQRWKHHHMRRHSDFELPHVPHLTTITTAIVPTAKLTEWRSNNFERYSIHLSDHATPSEQAPAYQGCVRGRRRWMIDHTMYVSSRNQGTQIYRSMDAKEVHAKQWTIDEKRRGRLIEHRSLDFSDPSLSDEPLSPLYEQTSVGSPTDLHSNGSNLSEGISQMVRKMSVRVRASRNTTQEPQPSIKLSSPIATIAEEQPPELQIESERRIPNAIFARKHGLYEEARAIPPYIRESRIAEDKIASKAKKAVARGARHSWAHKEPLTPQLWHDSGTDYRWSKSGR